MLWSRKVGEFFLCDTSQYLPIWLRSTDDVHTAAGNLSNISQQNKNEKNLDQLHHQPNIDAISVNRRIVGEPTEVVNVLDIIFIDSSALEQSFLTNRSCLSIPSSKTVQQFNNNSVLWIMTSDRGTIEPVEAIGGDFSPHNSTINEGRLSPFDYFPRTLNFASSPGANGHALPINHLSADAVSID